MSARVRQPAATPGPSHRASGNATLPDYQPPTFPLDLDAQRALANVHRKHNVQKLDGYITQAQDELTSTGAVLHERLRELELKLVARQRKEGHAVRSQRLVEFEQQVQDMREKVDSMTIRMEKEMRGLVDCRMSVGTLADAVKAAESDAKANASTQATTQHTQTQTRRQARHDAGADEENEDTEQHWDPTDPAGGSQSAPMEVFDKCVQQSRDKYHELSLYARYAENKDYVEFKKIIHDAQHPDAEPPDASQWFTETGAPAPGERRDENDPDASDDDIELVQGQISTKCPLTLQEFREPLTSTKCRHTFESFAILELIAQSTMRPKAAQCPVPGCSAILERGDVRPDKLTLRKIQRIQRNRQEQEAGHDSDDDMGNGTQGRGNVIDDDDDDNDDRDVSGIAPQMQPSVKPEPRATTSTSRAQHSQLPRPSQVVDLDESDDEMEDVCGR
ncbi:hypothetical protein CERZMDRAFT_88178 [Cercospora zeae-maydis SCOH1-5]|uniref:SP-RING-type domain-containing protein n=1 Tax=Cercospora zeae-maydis SCOH1-5 TaxID=717836 RepID=A0A6A6F2B4_9PEZI|nr:hypothetical protein CERZMDRAFT_88178 [Cercospora zeae-maydis SCOH1-5]